ncbi:MAG: DEAD/DEAH box helicase [Spirochaetes bacterium]|nr:DEAD/DEAH box helicase [Spirochaetota bacterium]
MNFTELNLDNNLLKGIKAAGFQECTPVQEATFIQTLNKKDVCVQSQTGTGKTAAFLISVFQLLLTDEKLKGSKTLIIAPTRELAVQIEKEAILIGKYLNFKTGCFYGGVGYAEQEKMLSSGIDIIVGTPGRLIDFSEQEKLNFKDIGILIIDEADRLFDMGFLPDITKMINRMPPQGERITMLFSATLSTKVRNIAWKYMNNPVEIEIAPENLVVENVTQEIYHVGKNEKFKLLLGILNKENPKTAIIFTNMKRTAEEVCKRLEHNGLKCHYIMGDLPQSKRLSVIEKVKSGKVQILVATEVAARGLHINDLELVVNYDLPEDCENYVHRIGRTARAGKSGKAISLACEKYVYSLEAIESLTKFKIPVSWATDDLFIQDKSEGIYFSYDKANKSHNLTDNRPHKSKQPVQRKRRNVIAEPSRGGKAQSKRYTRLNEKYSNSERQSYREKTSAGNFQRKPAASKKVIPRINVQPEQKQGFFKKIASIFSFNKNTDGRKIKTAKIKPAKKGSVYERMEYYKKKHGITFVPAKELLSKENKDK